MQFIETPIFTKQVTELLSDEEYCRLQEVLLMRPEAGDLDVYKRQSEGQVALVRIKAYFTGCLLYTSRCV